MSGAYYKHGGGFSVGGVALAAAAGAAIAVVMGALYAYAILYIPVIGAVTFVLTGGYGLIAGVLLGMIFKSVKTRNNAVVALVSSLVALVALYFVWVTWLYGLIKRGDVEDVSWLGLMLHPVEMLDALKAINQNGTWSLKGLTPTGGALWAIWACEALLIGLAMVFGAIGQTSDPFCETCQAWCKEHVLGQLPHTDADALTMKLEQREWTTISQMRAQPATPGASMVFSAWECEGCRETATLCFSEVKVVKDKTEKNEKMRHLVLQRGDVGQLRERFATAGT